MAVTRFAQCEMCQRITNTAAHVHVATRYSYDPVTNGPVPDATLVVCCLDQIALGGDNCGGNNAAWRVYTRP